MEIEPPAQELLCFAHFHGAQVDPHEAAPVFQKPGDQVVVEFRMHPDFP
jgi:hypothetical protein